MTGAASGPRTLVDGQRSVRQDVPMSGKPRASARGAGPAALLSCAALAIVGCYRSHEVGADAPGLVRDASVPGPRFDGALPDPRLDGALRDADGDARGVARDVGVPMLDAGCPGAIAPYVGPSCLAETVACLAACPDCVECYRADPPCERCVLTEMLRCAVGRSCGGSWSAYACCATRNPGCEGVRGVDLITCSDGCEDILESVRLCVNAEIWECRESANARCLPE